MPKLPTWEEAILTVLKKAKAPMHYREITKEIERCKLRGRDLGATP